MIDLTDAKILFGMVAAISGSIWAWYKFIRSPKIKEMEVMAEKRAERFHEAAADFISSYDEYTDGIRDVIDTDKESIVQLSVDFYGTHTRSFIEKFKDRFSKKLVGEFNEISKYDFPSGTIGNDEYQKIRPMLQRMVDFIHSVHDELNRII